MSELGKTSHAKRLNSPPMRNNRQPKIFYATQIGAHPPTIVLFTNGPDLFDDTYLRYLTKVLRDNFPFSEVAIKLVLRAKGEGVGKMAAATPEGEGAIAGATDAADEVPVVRKRPEKPAKKPKPVAASEPPPPPRPRKKKQPGSETWDL